MKRFVLALLMLVLPVAMHGQSLNYTPTPQAAYIYNGSTWTPFGSGGAFGQLSYTPPSFGMYCQVTAGAAWTPCTGAGGGSGGGSLTSFASNNAAPLFTTSVANPTTTPVLSFALTSQTANTFFAAPNGSAGTPVFRAIAPADIPAATNTTIGAVQLAAGQTSNLLTPVASTGNFSDLNGKPPTITFVTRGLMAEYQFNEGAGATTLLDTSGANLCSSAPCNLTLSGANTPAMTTQGLNLVGTSTVGGGAQVFLALPAAITGFRSMTAGTNIPDLANGVFAVPTNWSSTGASNGNNYFSLISNAAAAPNQWIVMTGPHGTGFAANGYIQSGSAATATQIYDSWIGPNVHTFTTGTSTSTDPDHIYLNGSEGNYIGALQGATAANVTGVFTLGNIGRLYPTYQTGFPGTVTCLLFYSVELTAAEALQNNSACNQLMNYRGLTAIPYVNQNVKSVIMTTGDSIFSNINSTPTVASLITGTTGTYVAYANGLPSWTCTQIANMVSQREALLFSSFAARKVAIAECGINDATIGMSSTQIADNIVVLGNTLKAAGANRIYLSTLMSSVGTGYTDATLKDVANPLIRAAALANGWGIIDFGSMSPNIGADGASTNTTYFGSDQKHPTTLTKTNYMAPAIVQALNEADGSTLDGGCPTTITATTYSEAAADGCIRVNNTSNAVAVTLPFCGGYSRARVVKNMGQTANVVTVAPFSGDLVDGTATAITVAAGATLVLRPHVVDATGVCHWEKQSNN